MSVKYELPNGDTVIAENAASEDTLRAILQALGGQTQKSKKEQADAAAAKAQKENTDEVEKSTKTQKKMSLGMNQVSDQLKKTVKDMGVTAVGIFAKFMTDYDNIAKNPIKTGAQLLNTAIDITTDLAQGVSRALPYIGEFLAGLEKAAAELIKAGNAAFADQLQKNVTALQEYYKVGVSFSGGMDEMQQTAAQAGLGILDFAKTVQASKEELNRLGTSGGEAADKLSRVMGYTLGKTSKDFDNIRSKLFKLGVVYDDQGPMIANYMANLQASGKLRGMTDKQIAEGSLEYAKNLKVISDFTGQDAKKLAAEARTRVLRSGLQQRLDKDQLERLQTVNMYLAKLGDSAGDSKDALTESIFFHGTILNEGVRTSEAGRDLIEGVRQLVLSGQGDIGPEIERILKNSQNLAKTSERSAAFTGAAIAKVTGPASAASKFEDSLLNMGEVSGTAVESSGKQADAMMNAQGLMQKTAELYDITMRHKIRLESKINEQLEVYTGLLETLNRETIDLIAKVVEKFGKSKEEKEADDRRLKSKNEMVSKAITGKDLSGKEVGFWDRYFNSLGLAATPMMPMFADGGKLGAGKVGIAGEKGPELISGPSTILSNASYEQLMIALDAMKEKKGVRFADNDFDWTVNMQDGSGHIHGTTPNRIATLRDRTKGFDQYNIKDIQEELGKRSEYSDMQRAKDAMDDEMGMGKDKSNKIDETNSLLSELVRTMKQTADNTARVAVNTN